MYPITLLAAGNDTLKLNETAGTITGGAGNDTIHLSGKADTVNSGTGNDTIHASTGTDTITTGAGTDTIIMGEMDVTAVAQVTDVTPTGMDRGVFEVTVDGNAYSVVYDTDIATTIDNFITAHQADIIADTLVTAVTDGTSKVTLTGDAAGTTIDIDMTYNDGGTAKSATSDTTAAVAGVSVNTKLIDFDAGTSHQVAMCRLLT